MNLRTLFESTSFNPDIQPITSSTPYPKRILNELSELNSPSSSHSRRNIRTQFHVSPPPKIFSAFKYFQEDFQIMLNPQIIQKTTTKIVSMRLFLKSAQKGRKELNVPHKNSEAQFHLALYPDLKKVKRHMNIRKINLLYFKFRPKATSTLNYLLFHV